MLHHSGDEFKIRSIDGIVRDFLLRDPRPVLYNATSPTSRDMVGRRAAGCLLTGGGTTPALPVRWRGPYPAPHTIARARPVSDSDDGVTIGGPMPWFSVRL